MLGIWEEVLQPEPESDHGQEEKDSGGEGGEMKPDNRCRICKKRHRPTHRYIPIGCQCAKSDLVDGDEEGDQICPKFSDDDWGWCMQCGHGQVCH